MYYYIFISAMFVLKLFKNINMEYPTSPIMSKKFKNDQQFVVRNVVCTIRSVRVRFSVAKDKNRSEFL